MLATVAVCTHNPRPAYLARVLKALQGQTLELFRWELLVVDNGSIAPLSPDLLDWHPHGKVIREDNLGLTHARLRACRESQSDLIVFVDDDNVLHADYLDTALDIANEYPHIGAWSGQCHPEYESEPGDWMHRYRGMLVIREFSKDSWSNLAHIGETMPYGAGLCIRRAVADAYLALHDSGQRPMLLDRRGTSLMSAGDNDLSACACDIGLGVGLFHKLELTHLISAGRTTEEYLIRLAEGIYYSAVYLRAFRGDETPVKTTAKWLFQFVQGWRMSARDRRIFTACCRGENRAIQELARNPISIQKNAQSIR